MDCRCRRGARHYTSYHLKLPQHWLLKSLFPWPCPQPQPGFCILPFWFMNGVSYNWPVSLSPAAFHQLSFKVQLGSQISKTGVGMDFFISARRTSAQPSVTVPGKRRDNRVLCSTFDPASLSVISCLHQTAELCKHDNKMQNKNKAFHKVVENKNEVFSWIVTLKVLICW